MENVIESTFADVNGLGDVSLNINIKNTQHFCLVNLKKLIQKEIDELDKHSYVDHPLYLYYVDFIQKLQHELKKYILEPCQEK